MCCLALTEPHTDWHDLQLFLIAATASLQPLRCGESGLSHLACVLAQMSHSSYACCMHVESHMHEQLAMLETAAGLAAMTVPYVAAQVRQGLERTGHVGQLGQLLSEVSDDAGQHHIATLATGQGMDCYSKQSHRLLPPPACSMTEVAEVAASFCACTRFTVLTFITSGYRSHA